MEYVRQTVNGAELNNFITLPPMLRNRKVQVIVLPAEDNDIETKPKTKRRLGFVDCPPLPESFFEPLPEEDLQAWGL